MTSFSNAIPKSLRGRLLAVYSASFLTSTLALALLLWIQVRSTLQEEFVRRGEALTEVLASDARRAALANAPETLHGQVSSLLENDDVVYAIVQDGAGQLVAQAAAPNLQLREVRGQIVARAWKQEERRAFEIRLEDGSVLTNFTAVVPFEGSEFSGTARVGISGRRLLGQVQRAFWTSLGTGLALSVVGLFGLLFLTNWMIRPLRRMADVARAIAAGDLSQRVATGSTDSNDEIGALARAFREMSEGLDRSRAELARRNQELEDAADEKERLYRIEELRARRLEARNELAKSMSTSLDPSEICGHVRAALSGLMPFDYFAVLRWNAEDERFSGAHSWSGVEGGLPSPKSLRDEDWRVLHEVCASKTSSVLGPEGERELPQWMKERQYTGAHLVPLVAGGDVLGVLCLGQRDGRLLASEDVYTVRAVADNLALVLKNADLFQRLDRSFTDLRETQERLAHSEEARRMDRLRTVGQMASGIAHNFNNVMSAIVGRVQLLKLKYLQGEIDRAGIEKSLDVIERAGLDGAETVRRLQEFSRGEASQRTVQTDLNELARSVIEITRPRWKDQAEQNGIRIQCEAKLEALPPIACIPSEIRECLTNLIFNAVDAMPEGGLIEISTDSRDGWAFLTVRDTGAGMPQHVRERIFEPFFTTKGVRGTGLGLSTVYGIVRRHGGDVAVDSEEGQGTSFVMTLPVARANAPRAEEEGLMGTRPWRILVGDDESNVREVLVELLRLLGHDVSEASGGREMLERFEPGRFDLVCTDLGMPDLSGWEVAEAIRGRDPEVPIVLATGWGTQIPNEEAARRGVTRVLAKPFTVQKVSSLVAELQGLRRVA